MGRGVSGGTDDQVGVLDTLNHAVVMAHVDLTPFRKDSWAGAAKDLWSTLNHGETWVVPAFTYACMHGTTYTKALPSEVGWFSEWCRFQGWARSDHPVFSFLSHGPLSAITADVGLDAFGPRSVFDRLVRLDGHVLFAGCGFARCTLVHYVEQLVGVDYRFTKHVPGTDYSIYARDLGMGTVTDLTAIERDLECAGILERDGPFLVGKAREIVTHIKHALTVDPHCLVRFEKDAA